MFSLLSCILFICEIISTIFNIDHVINAAIAGLVQNTGRGQSIHYLKNIYISIIQLKKRNFIMWIHYTQSEIKDCFCFNLDERFPEP